MDHPARQFAGQPRTPADVRQREEPELEPDQPNPYDSRGEILEMLGRPEEGREQFREAIRVDEFTGRRFTFFRDPDGLPLELYEVLRAGSQD